MARRKIALWLLAAGFTLQIKAQAPAESELKRWVYDLADDKMLGRGTGEKGEELAAEYLKKEFKRLKLKPFSKSGYEMPFSFEIKKYKDDNPHDSVLSIDKRQGKNIVAFLDNKAKYTVVIGAHYDHLGEGNFPGSLDPNPKGKIHNGADDNASGTAGLLALAKWYSTNKIKEPVNFIFAAFSGEELGLHGSKALARDTNLDTAGIPYMLNMDMIGRMDADSMKLLIYGIGTSPSFPGVLSHFNRNFRLVFDSSGMGPSDHASFYLQNIPVLHFFTGQHPDYHRPSDDAEKLNYAGMKQVLDYIIAINDSLAQMNKLSFTPTRSVSMETRRFKVTLGVIPDYTFTGKGMRIDGVSEGKPAALAGLQKGDIILKLGETDINSMEDYMMALRNFEKGMLTTVTIQRGNEVMTMPITL